MTREDHIQWCKDRANEHIDNGDITNAITSMISDLDKHPETKNHPANEIALMMLMTGQLNNPFKARDFINGYN